MARQYKGINDLVASSLLSAKVGTLRAGSRMFREFDEQILSAEDMLTGRSARSAGAVARRTGRELGRQIEDTLETFGDKRMALILERLRQTSGIGLIEPKAELNRRFLRGDVEKFMEKAAQNAAERTARIVKEGGAPEDALLLLHHHTKTVIRSGANAAHNAAVLAIAKRNKSVVHGVLAMATLDSRTTELCIGRHGGAWSLETNEPLAFSSVMEPFPGRPPWHFNCRTALSPIFYGEDVPDIQNREIDEWFDSDDAELSLGKERLTLFRNHTITREQLIEGL